MDLKDLVKKYVENGEEAFRALNAGHPETTETLLKQNEKLIQQYFDEKASPAGDVTKSATSEKPADETKETPAPASPAAAAGALGAQAAASQTKPPGL